MTSAARLLAAILIVSSTALQAGPFSAAVDPPERSAGTPQVFAKARVTPGFFQSDSRAEFPNGGRDYCCPVSVATAFLGLSRLGLRNLISPRADFEAQVEVVNTLASGEYLGTDPVEGTGPGALLRGVRKYVEHQGYRCARLEYQGWRPVGQAQQIAVQAKTVDADWLTAATRHSRSAVWANVGWYVPLATAGQYKRTGGHWITILDPIPSGTPTFIIRNSLLRQQPAPGDSEEKQQVTFTPFPSGEAVGPNTEPRPLHNFFELKGPALPTKPNVRALLDAAIVLVITE